ncbi:MAG: dTDP-4-dehydrorhamnose 3,5-epimerase, partial [Nitrospirota bacterium]|nr:dTDP-4-dehydrorhamnose 3,5-epimerase [Nitrospirota bacterium]MDX2419572.1 dTDP-4-dehydrorhamnose 3,5-epimerase [Nitrospirota bacterium]
WESGILSAENFKQLYIPPGFAHGFLVLSGIAEVEYKCTDVYTPGDEITIAWNDTQIGIQWPNDSPILSTKDASGPSLQEVGDRLPEYQI